MYDVEILIRRRERIKIVPIGLLIEREGVNFEFQFCSNHLAGDCEWFTSECVVCLKIIFFFLIGHWTYMIYVSWLLCTDYLSEIPLSLLIHKM